MVWLVSIALLAWVIILFLEIKSQDKDIITILVILVMIIILVITLICTLWILNP